MSLNRISAIAFLVSLVIWVASAFFREMLPNIEDVQPSLFSTPVATPTEKRSFDVTKDGITYNIKPLYDYELYGLIVSHHDANSIDDHYHEEWKDYINTKDICVVFGENARSGIYQHIKFTSGSWTCYSQWNNADDGAAFKQDQMSNNHLLTEDPELNKKILDAVRGDQIYLKGYIVKYGIGSDPKRGYDTFTLGKGECQVIYLTDFKILNQNPWKLVCLIFKWLTIALGGFWVFQFFFFNSSFKNE